MPNLTGMRRRKLWTTCHVSVLWGLKTLLDQRFQTPLGNKILFESKIKCNIFYQVSRLFCSRQCQKAGITVRMVTGDNINTAR